MADPSSDLCLHCGTPVPTGAPDARFCCAGCSAVYRLLSDEGLTRYYALADGQVAPALAATDARSFAWLDSLVAQAEKGGAVCALTLDVQGIHCAACVWLMQQLFARVPGGSAVHVNPALGKVGLRWRRGAFDVRRFLESVERFGYRFGPDRKKADRASTDLPLRLGLCAALTMNVMVLSFSFYLGLGPQERGLFDLFTWLSVALSSAVVLIGGWPFFKAAWRGLEQRVLHLDLPIALGILLVYVTSIIKLRDGRGDLSYFDTLNTFVTLMLVGRWLQHRILERNRRFLLDDDGAEGLFVRRLEGAALCTVPVAKVSADDRLLIAPGDLAPVDAELLDDRAQITTDWITGEPAPQRLGRGEVMPAGAFNAGERAVTVRARTAFDASPLVRLLRQPLQSDTARVTATRFWDRLARSWAQGVLAIAASGFLLWWFRSPDRALDVAVALLVVTCPCAIGIALPLAYELAEGQLRRGGFFVRSGTLLDRLPRVRKLLFDKTGTLTLGRLELVNGEALDALTPRERDVAFNLCSRSNHPVSRCLAAALERRGARFQAELPAPIERPGQGLELAFDGETWRLGRPGWAVSASPPAEGTRVALARDGQLLAALTLREAVRPDAVREMNALSKDGYEAWLISGDAEARVGELAQALGVPRAQVRGGQSPEDKARTVAALDAADTLFLGDGVNDSLAFQAALCAGTPAIDRPIMPARSDFFILGEGLAPLRIALEQAQHLRLTVRQVLTLAIGYNVISVTTCLLGQMSPLRAAVFMPLSSLSVLVFTAWRMSSRRAAPAPLPPRLKEVTA